MAGYWPEALLGLSACLILLGFLGSPQLWGKREQRAAAETLDTVENHHWLVAEIQGRPRLEKPPLPRWTAAAIVLLAGRCTEGLVRLPSALAGVATVALVYSLGRGIGGRPLGLTSAAALCTFGLFVSEHRQAGNDGMLALFTTLALHAAWCLIHGKARSLVFWMALGLGFLCKGPVVLMLVGVTVVPYLACTGGLRTHGRRFVALDGLAVFLALALAWPLAVAARDPQAVGVWITEMGQKSGVLGIKHRGREVLATLFPLLSLPWSVLGVAGVLLPAVGNRRVAVPWRPSDVWFPWWWAVGNLAVFSGWSVSKPNYFVPCLPGLAILVGMAWLRLCAMARDERRRTASRWSRGILGLQCGLLAMSAGLLPLVARLQLAEAPWPLLILISGVLCCGVLLGAVLARGGHEALAPLPVAACCAAAVLIGYGIVAPMDDPARGHAGLARRLDHLLPARVETVHFFHEIDEGLWFYLRDRRLAPVPGSRPRYSDSYDNLGSGLLGSSKDTPPALAPGALSPASRARSLRDWLDTRGSRDEFVLVRSSVYDRLLPEIEGAIEPVYRERGLKRNELVLLRAGGTSRPMTVARAPTPPRDGR
ncbi:MAG: glycosyltransferase family 39 protein [Isosphaeraceae bacterium]